MSLSDSSQTQTVNETSTLALSDGSRPVLGDVLALISAVFYALYVILLKIRIHSESRIDMQLFFGFVGLFNILLCWPIGVILHLLGAEYFELPGTGKEVGAILINVSYCLSITTGSASDRITQMGITLSSDYLYVIAMLKTTPLVVTVGLSLTIPLAVIGDFFLSKPSRGQVLMGAGLVLVSFLVVGFENTRPGAAEDLLEDELVDDGRGTQAQLQLGEEVELATTD